MEDLLEATQRLDARLLDAAPSSADLPQSTVLDSVLLSADLVDDSVVMLPPAEVDAGVRNDGQVARAQFAGRQIARATAGQLAAILATIREARVFPEVFVGPAPERQSARGERDRVEFAERAAIAELATSLGIGQNTVRNRLADAETLTTRLPAVWADFLEGEICYPNVRAILDNTTGLPNNTPNDTADGAVGEAAEDAAVWAEYDAKLAGPARTVNPGRMRLLARSLAEKLSAEPLAVRHARAREDRRVWVEAAADGMAWFGALQPADAAYRAYARINANAKHLAGLPGETRTIGQIRADVMADLLTGEGTPHEVTATVMITVPVLTLLNPDTPTGDQTGRAGQTQPTDQSQQADRTQQTSQAQQPTPTDQPDHTDPPDQSDRAERSDHVARYEQPAQLNGYGPIDPDTARRLAGKAPSFYRILTHPVSSAILDVDRTSYTVPADLKRWILATHTYCVFPGCNRLAVDCDIDHSLDWVLNGTTTLNNLAPVCRGDHRLKHKTRWKIIRHQDGTIQWESPLGHTHNTDPPPF
ncbi:HNH endonuclease signature motif containing protein [Rathayibacter soli]|uniref:HNH endonuclease signature motif containing protein n=1 Tax=Rathayibacter soli TaxID=3144168 RepID=UPI0027E3D688|nr:DUF222 domain-containing protein [Glaciibacter superstes]